MLLRSAELSLWLLRSAELSGVSHKVSTKPLRQFVRVWGGNGYQYDHFYERCDENGLLLWHDAPFTGKPQPTDDAFLALVRRETRYQARRLVGHASLALLSSNNAQV